MRRQRVAMEVTAVRLPADLLAELDALAAERERPRAFVVRKAIEAYLRNQRAEERRTVDELIDMGRSPAAIRSAVDAARTKDGGG